MSAAGARYSRLLAVSVGYEFRKQIQFRTGFVVRELLNGLVEPLVMLFVYTALYSSAAAGSAAAYCPRMQLTRGKSWLAAVCLAALVAAGCGGDDTTANEPEPTAPTTESRFRR